jgi:hypothetical protein
MGVEGSSVFMVTCWFYYGKQSGMGGGVEGENYYLRMAINSVGVVKVGLGVPLCSLTEGGD